MGERTEYYRNYKRKQRADVRKQGICIVCCSRRPRRGNKVCQPCIKQAAVRGDRGKL